MRYMSLFSGIEAASVAWHPMGWKPLAFAEIEPFPSAVLKHHYPDVPNLGDVTKFKEWPDLGTVDLICGGSPCQSFSVAGLRKGMDDPRGNMALVYLAIVNRYRPRWVVYENVPGLLSSNDGRDFGAFLGALAELGYGWCYRVIDAQFCRVDGFPRAVPQRRRRVFVVGYLGDWRRAAAVLSEPESVLGDHPPRREAGQGSSTDVVSSLTASGRGVERTGETRGQNPVIAVAADVTSTLPAGGNATGGDRQPGTSAETAATMLVGYVPDIVSQAMSSKWSKGSSGPAGDEIANLVTTRPVAATLTRGAESAGKGGYAGRRQEDDINLVAHSLRAEGFDASEDGTGRGTPIVPIAFNSREDPQVTGDHAGPLGSSSPQAQAIAFDTTQITSPGNYSNPQPNDPSHPLAAGAHAPAVAFQPRFARNDRGAPSEIAYPLTAEAGRTGKGDSAQCVQTGWAVRRLMPIECERLQGFPDGYTDIQFRGKPAADGPRYKALGNSMACNVMRWIGRRIEAVEKIADEINRGKAA